MAPDHAHVVRTPLTGVVVEVPVQDGALVRQGASLVVVEAMKMHHDVRAPVAGVVRELRVTVGAHVLLDEELLVVAPADVVEPDVEPEPQVGQRKDLGGVLARRALLLDAARPEAVSRRRSEGRRTARENLADLCDPGSFSEYGGLAVAAQKQRRSAEELLARTPADGLVCGTATVGGEPVAVLSYDFTVLAGTQGLRNHEKTDRLLEVARRQRLPVVLFAEGGGGRPGDTDTGHLFGLVLNTFRAFAALSGLVPRIGVASGSCFAGNAALLGCCDVVVATPEASIGMGGPAMIEGGGLGTVDAADVGPVQVLAAAGVVDVVADDEEHAVSIVRQLLGTLHHAVGDGACVDQAALRDLVPADPKRTHDPRAVLEVLADAGSVIELRPGFGRAALTAFARIGGRPVGVLANDPAHLSGAVDAEASDKLARFVQLCDAFALPVVSLVDTPGFMVGPSSEAQAMVRRCSRLFTAAATMSAPWVTVVLRRCYGLGGMAMSGGSLQAPLLTVAWPTGEFGAMGLEGAVRLAMRRELAALPDDAAREALVQATAAAVRAGSGALSMAEVYEIDDVIDPADTRRRVLDALRTVPPGPSWRQGRRRTMVDTW